MAPARHSAVTEICDVEGCEMECERTLNIKQVASSQLTLKNEGLRSVHLCKEHYKQYKKQSKTARQLDSTYDY